MFLCLSNYAGFLISVDEDQLAPGWDNSTNDASVLNLMVY